MARIMSIIQSLLDGELFSVFRGKLNANFAALNTDKIEATEVLVKTNTTVFAPTADYHPATKIYADGLKTSWDSVYDPTGVNADVFARANHTGTQAPATIATDSTNRFITDAERTLWNSKEDAIGTKQTGFNKAFGTIVGTVAEGSHSHTKAEIGLGAADNTSDVDKPVSTLQQAALDLKLNNTTADFTPLATPPAYQKGRLFYCDADCALSYYTDIPDVTVNIGQEMLMRVINNSGATIYNGYACRHDGVDVANGTPQIVLALADTTEHARVLGVATHDIADGEEGFLTTFGTVHDVVTSSFAVGIPIYLSETTPGWYTVTAPELITQVAGVLSSSVTGKLFVSIINNISLPTIFGIMQGNVDTYTMTGTGTFETIDNYTTEEQIGLPVTKASGVFTLPNTGWYRGTITAGLTTDDIPPSGSDTITLQFYNVTQALVMGNTTISVPSTGSAADILSRSANAPFQAVAGDEMVFRIGSADNTGDVVFTSISVDVSSINIR